MLNHIVLGTYYPPYSDWFLLTSNNHYLKKTAKKILTYRTFVQYISKYTIHLFGLLFIR